MAATTILPTGKAFVTSRQAARYLGTSRSTLLRLIERGEIESYRTCGGATYGHQRVSVKSIMMFAHGEEVVQQTECNGGGGKIVCYARVSSLSQDKAGSLNRQKERLLEEVSQREGIKKEEIVLITDVASAFSNRDGLNRVIDLMIQTYADGNGIEKVYVVWQDRLARIPGQLRLIEHIAQKCGVEVIALDMGEDMSESEILTKEILGFITVYCNKASSAKAREVVFKTVSDECISRMVKLREAGLSCRQVGAQLEKEGWTTEKGDRLSDYKIRQILDSNGCETAVKAVCGSGDKESGLARWFKKHVRKMKRYNAKTDRVKASAIYDRYKADMGDDLVDTRTSFGQKLGLLAPSDRIIKTMGSRHLIGYRMTPVR